MTRDLSHWTPCPLPARQDHEGRYVRLEPLSAERHGDDLFAASTVPDAEERFRWLAEYPPRDRAEFGGWMEKVEASADPLYFAVIDRDTGRAVGRQTLMRIDAGNGVIEIGNIYWGPEMARTRGATEALFLFMRHVFEDLGYRRFEWKCNDDNIPSKLAARRFGFAAEGVFRQHMIVKGLNRDTAWFAMIDGDWPGLKAAYEGWLDPGNFDADGRQKRRLQAFIAGAA
jgi:RimJ/RimL family protein N-acetyltransferase